MLGVNLAGTTFDVTKIVEVKGKANCSAGFMRGLLNRSVSQGGRGVIKATGVVLAPIGRVVVELTVIVVVLVTNTVPRLGFTVTVPGRQPVPAGI